MQDGFLELWLRLLVLKIEEQPEENALAHQIRNIASEMLVEIGEAFLKLISGHIFGNATGSYFVPSSAQD
jgi:hypothetical protein